MAEPQIPGQLQGMPTEGNPAPVQYPGSPGYTEGVTPNMRPYAPTGNPTVNTIVPRSRANATTREWGW